MLNQIVYLRCDALIGRANYTQHELAEIGCPWRAAKLQDDGAVFVVSDAVAFAQYLRDYGDEDGMQVEITQFLNRVRNFPLDWRTPEWEKLVAKLNAIKGLPVTLNVSVNGIEVRNDSLE